MTLHVAELDRSAAVQLALPGVTGVSGPSWAPDSKRIAFGCSFGRDVFEICVVSRDGTGFSRLTDDAALDTSPAWSPDGSRIAFVTTRFTGQEIALMTPSGTGVTKLTSGIDPAWSPDGSKLVFARNDGLFTIGADGSNLTRLTTGRHRAPAWRR